jgi:mannosyltransferase
MNGPKNELRADYRTRAVAWLRAPGRLFGLLAFVVLVFAAVLRLHAINRYALWLDEGYSWWDARQSLSDLWKLVPQCDPHPPLYFVLLKGWMAVFGDTVLSMRLPSALIGVATTAVVILAGREIRARVGLLAGLMFAITPFQIEFSHEARPYALLCLGAALVTWGCLRVARLAAGVAASAAAGAAIGASERALWRDGSPTPLLGGLALLLFGGAITLWTNDTSVLFIFAAGSAFTLLFLFDRATRVFFKPVAITFALMVLVWLPNLPLLLEQAAEVTSDFWITRPAELWRVANELRFLVSVSVFSGVWWSVATMGCALWLLRRRGAWREAALLAALIVVPVAMNWTISMTIKPIYIARALIAIAPAASITLAAAAMLLSTKTLRRAALCALVAVHLTGFLMWRQDYLGKERWDSLAEQLVRSSNRVGPGDAVVLVTANELALPLAHAFEDVHATSLLPISGVPADFPAPNLVARYPSGKCAPSLQGLDLDSVKRAVAGHHTVFFVTRKDNVYDPGQRVAKFLRALGMKESRYELFTPGYLEIHTFVDNRVAPLIPLARRATKPAVTVPTGAHVGL